MTKEEDIQFWKSRLQANEDAVLFAKNQLARLGYSTHELPLYTGEQSAREDAAKEYFESLKVKQHGFKEYCIADFIAGAKWQAQSSVSKEEGWIRVEDVEDLIYNAFSAGFYTPSGAMFQPSVDKYITDLNISQPPKNQVK